MGSLPPMIVVTGANGFIGSVLVEELNREGLTDILCVDPVSVEQRPGNLKNLKYNKLISEKDFLKTLSEDNDSIDFIFHMGACSSTTETNKEYLTENNLNYTKKVFQYCTDKNIGLIYASSGAVYGDGNEGFSDETDPKKFKPLNLYGWSKSDFDVWALEQQQTPPQWYGLRFFNVYGPNEYHKENMKSVVCKAFEQISKTNSMKLFRSHNPQYEDGKQLRDFVYVKDITRWMIELFKTKKAKSGIYNMGYGEARTWLDLVTPVFKAMNKPVQIEWIDIPENIRNQYQYFTESKMEKLMSQGLSKPQWDVEKGVMDYVSNYLMKR